jgi:cell cycle checkpoint control protein RAD9A
MTVGERGSNPTQKTKKGRKNAPGNTGPRLEAASRRTSVAPSEAPQKEPEPQAKVAPPAAAAPKPSNPTPSFSSTRASASRIGAFDLRPTQQPVPPTTLRSESLFVDDDGWQPVGDDDDDGEDNARLEWDHSAAPVSSPPSRFCKLKLRTQDPSAFHMSRPEETQDTAVEGKKAATDMESTYLEPTQRLSDVRNLALFPD